MNGSGELKVCFESSESWSEQEIDGSGWLLSEREHVGEKVEENHPVIKIEWPEPDIPEDWGSPRRRKKKKS